jgi:hypothetical protein
LKNAIKFNKVESESSRFAVGSGFGRLMKIVKLYGSGRVLPARKNFPKREGRGRDPGTCTSVYCIILEVISIYLKVPKCENFHRTDFFYFYTIKPLWVRDFRAKIKKFKNFNF